jgi:hypothetical protein
MLTGVETVTVLAMDLFVAALVLYVVLRQKGV